MNTALPSREQIAALREIQEQESSKSPLNIASTIHIIARQLMDNALKQLQVSNA